MYSGVPVRKAPSRSIQKPIRSVIRSHAAM
jgi:hypothetical protein